MDVRLNLRVKTKNHTADPEKGFFAKSIFKPHGCPEAMPTAWELVTEVQSSMSIFKHKFDWIGLLEQ